MITRFLKTIFSLGALSVFALAANAQSPVARVTVPFEFAASGAMMPAGEYTIDVPDLSGVLLLRGSGNSVALLTTLSGTISKTTTAKLIFDRRDGMAYLSTIEWPEQSAHVMSAFKRITKGTVAAALR